MLNLTGFAGGYAPGLHPGMEFDKYKQIPALNKSLLMELDKTPAHFKLAVNSPRPPTPQMEFGTAFHDLVLEPDEFANRHVVEGASLIDDDDLSKLHAMRQAVETHAKASKLCGRMAEGERESTVLWLDADTSLPMKARIDLLQPDNAVVDLKSAYSSSEDDFFNAAEMFSYHVQAAIYLDGLRNIFPHRNFRFHFVVVEKSPPHKVACYELDSARERRGRDKYKELLDIYLQCRDNEKWPAYKAIEINARQAQELHN